jgi:GntR family transcriptional regulator
VTQQPGKAPLKYRQIAGVLRERIERGDYPVGTQLPTKPELAAEQDAAQGTVDAALTVLRELGLVETRQGSGTFVVRQLPAGREPSPEFMKIMERLDGMEAEIRRQAGRIAELEREQQRLRGQ